MSIKLVREDALVIRVTDIINAALVDYGKFARLSKDVSIKDEDELHPSSEDKLYRCIGNSGLMGFVKSEIDEILVKSYGFDSKTITKSLRDIPEFKNPVDVGKKMIARLKQLPERYRMTVPLSPQFSIPLLPYVSSVRIGENIAVCRAEKLLPMATSSNNKLIDESLFSDIFSESMNTDRSLSEDRLYLTSIELGYVTATRSSLIAETFIDKIRALYGAMAAMGVTSAKFKSEGVKKPFALIHRGTDNLELLSTVEIPNDIWDRRWYQSTEEFVTKSDDKPSAIKSCFDRVSLIFSDDEFSQKAATACIWYYRALNSTNVLDRILHATIAIEVLVGDRETADSVGLTKLLGNRCAYLLGKTRVSRQSIIDDFIEIYRVRSAIVHGGKHKIDKRDRYASENCLNLCAAIISRELELHQAQDLNSSI